MSYWTCATDKGIFSIVERASRGVDACFGQTMIGHFRSPVQAAEAVGKGNHSGLPCAPRDGQSLGVPSGVHQWMFVRE